MDAVNSILGLTRGSLFSFMMQYWKQSTYQKKKKKTDKYLFHKLNIYQNIKLGKKYRYTYTEHTTSAKVLTLLVLAISSKKEKSVIYMACN